jgi:hypothetical protein
MDAISIFIAAFPPLKPDLISRCSMRPEEVRQPACF